MDKFKLAFVDIGELSWSLYLSAHLRWLKENTNYSLAVITSFNRKCLYKGLTDLIFDIPCDFYEKFKGEQSCFGLCTPARKELKGYFQKLFPSDYIIPEYFNFGDSYSFLLNKVIYKPYTYSKKLEGRRKILIFPRYRSYLPFSNRNLPKSFYIKLIEVLCNEFHDYEIETSGLISGSYNIEVDKDNYKNEIKDKSDLQDLIDSCQLTVVAVGGVSAPPKISLLQGVPTFIIGHDKKRYIQRENWMNTKVGFYEVDEKEYAKIDIDDCIQAIVAFVRESKIILKEK